MKKLAVTYLLILTALTTVPSVVQASTCADRSYVVHQLQTRFGEALWGNAVSRDDAVLEIYTTPSQSTWTILVTIPERGLACLVASGSGAQTLNRNLGLLSS
jgi:hypothetical protein